MDRGSQVLSSGIWAGICLVAFSASAAGEARIPRHLAWETSNFAELGDPRNYKECLRTEPKQSINLGRVAFNSPRLLGGQAGRLGLSCNSCHVAGQDNPRFFIQQISGAPGTVDLSNSFFSSAGGDNKFNPIPIPNLSNRVGLKFGSRQGDAFENHISKLIQLEFDGQPPTKKVKEALLAYLDALDSTQCKYTRTSRKFSGQKSLIIETLTLLKQNIAEQDLATAEFLLKSYRAQLESLYLSLGALSDQEIDKQLIGLSRAAQSTLAELPSKKDSLSSVVKTEQDSILLLDLIEENLAKNGL